MRIAICSAHIEYQLKIESLPNQVQKKGFYKITNFCFYNLLYGVGIRYP